MFLYMVHNNFTMSRKSGVANNIRIHSQMFFCCCFFPHMCKLYQSAVKVWVSSFWLNVLMVSGIWPSDFGLTSTLSFCLCWKKKLHWLTHTCQFQRRHTYAHLLAFWLQSWEILWSAKITITISWDPYFLLFKRKSPFFNILIHTP